VQAIGLRLCPRKAEPPHACWPRLPDLALLLRGPDTAHLTPHFASPRRSAPHFNIIAHTAPHPSAHRSASHCTSSGARATSLTINHIIAAALLLQQTASAASPATQATSPVTRLPTAVEVDAQSSTRSHTPRACHLPALDAAIPQTRHAADLVITLAFLVVLADTTQAFARSRYRAPV
jgi:hypothetical protein